jgi:hypothetical protein
MDPIVGGLEAARGTGLGSSRDGTAGAAATSVQRGAVGDKCDFSDGAEFSVLGSQEEIEAGQDRGARESFGCGRSGVNPSPLVCKRTYLPVVGQYFRSNA